MLVVAITQDGTRLVMPKSGSVRSLTSWARTANRTSVRSSLEHPDLNRTQRPVLKASGPVRTRSGRFIGRFEINFSFPTNLESKREITIRKEEVYIEQRSTRFMLRPRRHSWNRTVVKRNTAGRGRKQVVRHRPGRIYRVLSIYGECVVITRMTGSRD